MEKPKEKIRPAQWIAALLMGAMALIAFINVMSRYLFHFSFAATEELTINLFVWMTVVGSGLAFERGGQLGMVTAFNYFPRAMKKSVIIFSAAMSSALFLLVVIYMLQAIKDELTIFHATSGALDIPVWIYYLGVPVLSVFVFNGIYRGAQKSLGELKEAGR